MRTKLRSWLVVGVLGAGTLLPAAGPAPTACAAEGPHAVLVIDRGTEGGALDPLCVALDDETVSGRDFIVMAAEQHAVVNDFSFGHNNEAMCMLADVGSSESACLDAGEPYWGYWRSDGDGWQSSSVGFTDTRVEDGDIEGWSWAQGAERPPHPSFEAVCGYDPDADPSPGGEGEKDDEKKEPKDPPDSDDPGTDVHPNDPGTGTEDASSAGPSGPRAGKPPKLKNPFPSAEPEPDERRIDSAPDVSELSDAPTPEPPVTALPASATSAGADEPDFPIAGILALVATFAMAGVAALLVRKRAPAKPEN